MLYWTIAMPLLGVLLWILSIHCGTFTDAILPTGLGCFISNNKNDLCGDLRNAKIRHKITDKDLNQSVAFGSSVVDRMLRLETNLGWSNIHIKKGTPSHGEYIESAPELEALKQGKEALVVAKATSFLVNSFCHRNHLSTGECSKYISSYTLKSTPMAHQCELVQKQCTVEENLSPYRTFDGSCNHFMDGDLGQSFTIYQRLISPNYLDGVQSPRRSVTKVQLPSARLISTTVSQHHEKTENIDRTLAFVHWGQFIEHDLSHTAASKMVHTGETIECCSTSGSSLSPRYLHPFCQPIEIPRDDKYYSQHNMDCMTYVRSIIGYKSECQFGHIDQLNQATHFLDGSQIYGSTLRKASKLRNFEDGHLDYSTRANKMFLPEAENSDELCQVSTAKGTCFRTGDSRTNLHPHLGLMHTVWLREHNRIARQLKKVNPAWGDEILFQEARRIVLAEIQHITYHEWLPLLLGKNFAEKINGHEYNEYINPSVSNAFATAAMRALYSLVQGNLELTLELRNVKSLLALHDFYRKPDMIKQDNNFDVLLKNLATQESEKMDTEFTEDLTTQLYSNGKYGFDLLSLDIQRGRDHGLPSYNTYRKLCSVAKAHSFDDLKDTIPLKVIEMLKKAYAHVDDIDLVIGGISEAPQQGSLLGPTFSCILADQFLRTRRGDRYFYTSESQPSPFSEAQLGELKKVTLARIFCDNSDSVQMIQPSVFNKISATNPLVECNSSLIPEIKLDAWVEVRYEYL